ncbi:MAG TPA: hypothetical protein VGU65_07650 [Frateuria sp.]|uniref:hypothetical protein n=1 Tax=Frateuria sp. TaxID=2211372 RepID=UPI002DE61D9E|nr:hypothetical protein [Frateuria sp.]
MATHADLRPTIPATVASLWTGLLFLHGYLGDWRLDRRLADRLTPDSPVAGTESTPPDPPRVAPNGGTERRVRQGIGDGDMRHQ